MSAARRLELGGTDWFEVEGFKTYVWDTTPGTGRPVLFADEVFPFGTLPDGTLAGTKKVGAAVTMISFKDGKIGAHAPKGARRPRPQLRATIRPTLRVYA